MKWPISSKQPCILSMAFFMGLAMGVIIMREEKGLLGLVVVFAGDPPIPWIGVTAED